MGRLTLNSGWVQSTVPHPAFRKGVRRLLAPSQKTNVRREGSEMAMGKGVTLAGQVKVINDIDEVRQILLGSLSVINGSDIQLAGENTMIVNRRYIPTWAIVVAVIGFFFFFIGLLVLLYRENETCTIQLRAVEGGTIVTISGTGDSVVGERLNAALSSLNATA